MNSIPPSPDPAEHDMWQLVAALNQMRDALTRVALQLRDFQFEQDAGLRGSVEAEALHLLQKFKAH